MIARYGKWDEDARRDKRGRENIYIYIYIERERERENE